MAKIGPREAQLQAMREDNLRAAKAKGPRDNPAPDLKQRVAEASKKRGKLVKRKKK